MQADEHSYERPYSYVILHYNTLGILFISLLTVHACMCPYLEDKQLIEEEEFLSKWKNERPKKERAPLGVVGLCKGLKRSGFGCVVLFLSSTM